MWQKILDKAAAQIEPQTLYVVATPIGNLADITLRALAVLQRADLVCAEDTRVSQQLLSAYGIRAKLVSVREHNERQMTDTITAALAAGWWRRYRMRARRQCATPGRGWPRACGQRALR